MLPGFALGGEDLVEEPVNLIVFKHLSGIRSPAFGPAPRVDFREWGAGGKGFFGVRDCGLPNPKNQPQLGRIRAGRGIWMLIRMRDRPCADARDQLMLPTPL